VLSAETTIIVGSVGRSVGGWRIPHVKASGSPIAQCRRLTTCPRIFDGVDGLLDLAWGRASPAFPSDVHDGEEVGDQRAQAEPPRRVGGKTKGDPEHRN